MDWRQFQEKVALRFRAAGCHAKVDMQIEGARGTHKVDVYVAFNQYGIKCSWIVECKFWNRNVPKEKVMALGGIVSDCGADRGLIISRRGFQSGAVRAAQKTNITLTSIEDLLLYISDETKELEQLQQRLAEIKDKLGETSQELEEYRCPECGSSLVSREPIWYDEKSGGDVEVFECGYVTGGYNDRPCPFGPDFPSLDEYHFTLFSQDSEPDWKYHCCAMRCRRRRRRGASSWTLGMGRLLMKHGMP
jgi:hypothetical protein